MPFNTNTLFSLNFQTTKLIYIYLATPASPLYFAKDKYKFETDGKHWIGQVFGGPPTALKS